jgi:DNA-binding response OmpR family regulator
MKCILIVEDEPLIALNLRYACEEMGVDSITASSCRMAMEALEERDVDGAVLDVNLGRGDTCEAIAKELKARNVPFVLNTGDLNRAGEYLRGIDAPIISKPTAAEVVIERLLAMSVRAS